MGFIHITADYREKRSGVPDLLRKQKNVNLTWRQLTAGDYILNDHLRIERKAAKDFVLSIIRNRLFKQCAGLKRSGSYTSLLIVEGDPYASGLDINSEAVRGALLSVASAWQIPVLFSDNKEDTARLILRSGKQMIKNQIVVSRGGCKPKRIKSQQLFFLQGIPVVGPILAKKLLDHFGSLKKVLNAAKEELMAVPGIGDGKARKIAEFLES